MQEEYILQEKDEAKLLQLYTGWDAGNKLMDEKEMIIAKEEKYISGQMSAKN